MDGTSLDSNSSVATVIKYSLYPDKVVEAAMQLLVRQFDHPGYLIKDHEISEQYAHFLTGMAVGIVEMEAETITNFGEVIPKSGARDVIRFNQNNED